MPVALTLHGVDPETLIRDVYFDPSFVALHATPDPIDSLQMDGFTHTAAIRDAPGIARQDLETPWGYGGPIGVDHRRLAEGMAAWRERQQAAGRLAEFVRLHPFLNAVVVKDYFHDLIFDRETVLVDLRRDDAEHWRGYSQGTRYRVNAARKRLAFRPLAAEEWPVFHDIYTETMDRNQALGQYYLDDAYFQALLAAPWNTAFVVEDADGPVAVSSYLTSESGLVHYHLTGVSRRGRNANANYLLLTESFRYFRERGKTWMHLGGGRTRAVDDSLLHFKGKFSPVRGHFFVGGIVYDTEAYKRLGGKNGRIILGYRAPTPQPVLTSSELELRLAAPDAFSRFFRLKCDINNVVWSGHDRAPDWQHLKTWYETQMSGDGRLIFLAFVDGECVGYAYADRIGADAWETSVGVDKIFAGRGLGASILRALAARLKETAPGTARLDAYILADNVVSERAHAAAGFRRTGEPRAEHRRWEFSYPAAMARARG